MRETMQRGERRSATSRPERYIADDLLPCDAEISVTRQQVRSVDVHWHDFYELVYVTDGTALHLVNGSVHELRPGSVFLLTPADFHEIRTRADDARLSFYNVVIDADLVENGTDGLCTFSVPGASWAVDDAEDLERDFRRLWDESRTGGAAAARMMRAVLACILIELDRRCSAATRYEHAAAWSRDQPDVMRALLFVDRHFREPLTLAGVAAQAHLSPNYFSERFHEVAGTSFQVYLQQRRLRFARSLLASTNLGVTEVCHAAGFNSLSHFGRAYRSLFGVSPSSSRRSLYAPHLAPVHASA